MMKVIWIVVVAASMGACAAGQREDAAVVEAAAVSPNPAAYGVGEVICRDEFKSLVHWQIELENGGKVRAHDGVMEMDMPDGCTTWYVREFSGPVMFEYEARMVRADPPGPNDRVSDLNCFWMATDPRELPNNFFDVDARTGAFATYDAMKGYYVGLGGNSNTTTRFRRYIGELGNRPLLPEHDLSAEAFLLKPNVWQQVQVVACGELIEYYREGKRIFSWKDPEPYRKGQFGIRTTWNHMEVRRYAAIRLVPKRE